MLWPNLADGSAEQRRLRKWVLGVFQGKLELFCEYFNLTYDDFNDADKMPSVFRKQIYITISKVLIKALEEGNPILEEDGRLMWVNTCPWKSIPGVPYISQ